MNFSTAKAALAKLEGVGASLIDELERVATASAVFDAISRPSKSRLLLEFKNLRILARIELSLSSLHKGTVVTYILDEEGEAVIENIVYTHLYDALTNTRIGTEKAFPETIIDAATHYVAGLFGAPKLQQSVILPP